MKTKSLFILFFLQVNICCIAQRDSSAYQRFYADMVKAYASFSKKPLKNFYEALSNAAEYSFNVFNPHFTKALTETIQQFHLEERNALDSLFKRTLTDLRNNDLWISSKEIYETQKPILDVYTRFLCPCLTQEVKNTSRMKDLVNAMQTCAINLIKDTAYLNTVKRVAGDKTMNDLLKLQSYMSISIYQDCKIVNDKFNETIFNYPVYEQYVSGLREAKGEEAKKAILYFKNKKFDSLSLIFPNYRKFIPELTKLVSKLNLPDVYVEAYYTATREQTTPHVNVSLMGKDVIYAEMEMTSSLDALNSTFVTAKLKVYNPPKKFELERIEEIKEDSVPKKE